MRLIVKEKAELEERSVTSSEGEVADITRVALEKEVSDLRQKSESMRQQVEGK